MKILLATFVVAGLASRVAFAQLASDQPAPASQTPPKTPQTESAAALPSAQPVSAGVTAPATTGDSSAVLASSQPASTAPEARSRLSRTDRNGVRRARGCGATSRRSSSCCNKVTPTWCQCSLAAASHARFSILRFVPGDP